MVGRKNFAMSICDDIIYVTGGMDNSHNPLSEFLMFSPRNGIWLDMKQTRKKDKLNRLVNK